jgi:hypothetical protein
VPNFDRPSPPRTTSTEFGETLRDHRSVCETGVDALVE